MTDLVIPQNCRILRIYNPHEDLYKQRRRFAHIILRLRRDDDRLRAALFHRTFDGNHLGNAAVKQTVSLEINDRCRNRK